MGLNEFSGYLAVAGAAYATAVLASSYGLHPYPFLVGVGASVCGLALSFFFVEDTRSHVEHEARAAAEPARAAADDERFRSTRGNLLSCHQAGFVTNLNDAIAWGIFPVHLALLGFPLETRGLLAGLYPATWGATQLLTGALSDRWGRKWLIAGGMWLQSAAIALVLLGTSLASQVAAALLLGIGTAMVYPVLLSSVGDSVRPLERAAALGHYRFWRDSGYAAGALVAGVLADLCGLSVAISAVAVLTGLSGLYFAARYHEERADGTT
jgi:predicted MFS family arabinose efflux permease